VRERNNPNAKLKTVSAETKEILIELERDYKPAKSNEKDELSMQKADKFNAVSTSFARNLYWLRLAKKKTALQLLLNSLT